MKYDIIGDIHGYADQLEKLLKKLNYLNNNGVYTPLNNDRKAVFVGDFIDRGPKIEKTLSIVKSMVDSSAAYAVLGNHEYNALCFHTLKKGSSDSWLRPHSAKNINQHKETLQQFKDHPEEWKEYLSWFMTLPLYLDLGDIRVVHASWIPSEISKIKKWTNNELKLDDILLQKSAEECSNEFNTLETVLKGVEINLPKGAKRFKDKDGNERNEIRVKWWESMNEKTYEEMIFPPDKSQNFGKQLIESNAYEGLPVYNDDVPVFFGHYWLDPTNLNPPQIQKDQICCLDYSVAKNGLLVAYSCDGEEILSNDKFVFVE